ncbi:hypothetical protein FLM55_00440 [Francisella sp. Scap27]|uniref:hypothetical protein n=1 Tax=Francisella sp. Scap27 TaxID=2589986 RepID=UPI0015BDF418|nr:hypothetical protein [Francisella sp. Scap27]QLE78285.1 hypothetical protein FLM55_00440 [Francisella sp. Scap27]
MRNINILFLAITVFCSIGFAEPNDDISLEVTNRDKKPVDKTELSAEDVLEEQINETPTSQDRYDIGQAILKYSGLKNAKLPLFKGIDNSVLLSEAVLNTQKQTGDPLFELLARQDGTLKDDYLYFGATGVSLPIWGKQNSINNYSMEYYFLSTLGNWTTVYASLNTYTNGDNWNVNPGAVYLMLGDLRQFPVFTYAALSTINFGSFDETTNFFPTLTRFYFMQSGGNVNVSYNRGGIHADVAFLSSSENKFLKVANAYNGNTKLGVSTNLKYTYELEQDGDYWYAGTGYSNVSGFTNNNNDNIGVIDFNFGLNIRKIQFINEFVFTDKGVDKTTDASGSFNLREGFFTSILPDFNNNVFLQNGSNVYSWSSQFSYSANLYNHEFIPYVSYSQIQQSSSNYRALIDTGFRYNPFADAWAGFSYSHIRDKADLFEQQDNILALYLRIFI